MTQPTHARELHTLKTIAETLNQSNDVRTMLSTVLRKLIEVTGLATGWIFLVDENGEYECVADCSLPPALARDDKQPMKCGSCWCINKFRDNRLVNAANIMSCKRIESSIAAGHPDTAGIRFHATVPLRAGSRRLGVLNVAAPNKKNFSEEELDLLEAVAFQIGGAVERLRLHAEEQRRAVLYARLAEFGKSLSVSVSEGLSHARLLDRAAELIRVHFDWPFAALQDSPDMEPPMASVLAAPVGCRGCKSSRYLLIGHGRPGGFSSTDREVFQAVAEHLSVALEGTLLERNRRELARLEERNRLARDLHDSVAQMLFSLSMTAKGSESLLGGDNRDEALSALKDMQQLSKNALKEMRALIMQLRPEGLENGIVAAMENYGRQLGLALNIRIDGILELPPTVEESLWRISQEAMNNVRKHAGTFEASIRVSQETDKVRLEISDRGRGIQGKRDSGSIGLSTMRERAEAIGGSFRLTSTPKGTTVRIAVPIRHKKSEVKNP